MPNIIASTLQRIFGAPNKGYDRYILA